MKAKGFNIARLLVLSQGGTCFSVCVVDTLCHVPYAFYPVKNNAPLEFLTGFT